MNPGGGGGEFLFLLAAHHIMFSFMFLFYFFIAGIREWDPMGYSYVCGFLRPGRHVAHLPAHRSHGFLGPGWRNRLHYDVPTAGLCALLQHLQWLRSHCGLSGGLFFKTFVWRAVARTTACHPLPRMHPWRRCLCPVFPYQDHLHAGCFCHHIAGLLPGFSALQQRSDTWEVGCVSS